MAVDSANQASPSTCALGNGPLEYNFKMTNLPIETEKLWTVKWKKLTSDSSTTRARDDLSKAIPKDHNAVGAGSDDGGAYADE